MIDETAVGREVTSSDEPVRIRSWQEILGDNTHKKPINERVDAMTLVKGLNLKEIDLLTLKRLIKFARFNTKNDWGIAIKTLLDSVESDSKTMMLYDKIISMENNIEELYNMIIKNDGKKEAKKVVKTFGAKEE